ncbi:hypothetical protein BD310DRAFT_1000703 [Dichomitus squalens]|uniref:F-box domain-containing protein n=1 Tax=Dichomitus squalens TaxID=114155 RepID=A0A4Q9PFN6_9APHY|nr:hypothetical protein BD310DRAFT_1000703 [Dichomitus squalens]
MHPSATSHATLEQPLARPPTTISWTTEYFTKPPPYDACDTAALMAAAYADKSSSQRRPQDVAPLAGSFLRGASAAPWISSPRRSALYLLIPYLPETILSAVRMHSPVQCMPNDPLSSIFSIAVLDEEDEDLLTFSNLMLMCPCWGEVAINSPMLWTCIAMERVARANGDRNGFAYTHTDLSTVETLEILSGGSQLMRLENECLAERLDIACLGFAITLTLVLPLLVLLLLPPPP